MSIDEERELGIYQSYADRLKSWGMTPPESADEEGREQGAYTNYADRIAGWGMPDMRTRKTINGIDYIELPKDYLRTGSPQDAGPAQDLRNQILPLLQASVIKDPETGASMLPFSMYEYEQNAMRPFARQKSGFDKFLTGIMDNGPLIMGGAVVGGGLSGLFDGLTAGGAGGGIGGGAGGAASGLSAETLAWMQAAGYTPAEIASIGSQFGAGGALTSAASGLTDVQQWAQKLGGLNPDGSINWSAIDASPEITSMGSLEGAPVIPTSGATAAGASTASNGASALSKILSGNGSAEDYFSVLGKIAPAALGAYASNKQSSQLGELADKFAGYGAPYRDRLSALYQNPSSFLNSPEVQVPVQQGTDIMARSLSTRGNPTGSGNALQQLQSYASDQLFGRLGQEKDRLAGFGGLSAYNQAAPSAATASIGSNANMFNAIGSGMADVFNPPKTPAQTLADLLKVMK